MIAEEYTTRFLSTHAPSSAPSHSVQVRTETHAARNSSAGNATYGHGHTVQASTVQAPKQTAQTSQIVDGVKMGITPLPGVQTASIGGHPSVLVSASAPSTPSMGSVPLLPPQREASGWTEGLTTLLVLIAVAFGVYWGVKALLDNAAWVWRRAPRPLVWAFRTQRVLMLGLVGVVSLAVVLGCLGMQHWLCTRRERAPEIRRQAVSVVFPESVIPTPSTSVHPQAHRPMSPHAGGPVWDTRESASVSAHHERIAPTGKAFVQWAVRVLMEKEHLRRDQAEYFTALLVNESGWGQSVYANNLGNIKGSPRNGKTVAFTDRAGFYATYVAYDSPEEGLRAALHLVRDAARYRSAWRLLMQGDPLWYSELGVRGYFEGPVDRTDPEHPRHTVHNVRSVQRAQADYESILTRVRRYSTEQGV